MKEGRHRHAAYFLHEFIVELTTIEETGASFPTRYISKSKHYVAEISYRFCSL